jgi:glycosyltransferase involved in cell wall biosynthesis
MRICYLGDTASPHLMKFIEYFANRGNEIHVISLRGAKCEGARIHNIPRRTRFEDIDYLLSLFWLKRIITSMKPDVLHAHYLTSYGLLGAVTGFHPYIVTAWGTDLLITPKKGYLYKLLLKFMLKRADLVFADAFFMKEELLRYGAKPERVLICPFGVDMKLFRNQNRKHSDTGKIGILSMRTLIKNSNIDVILSSMKILNEHGIDFVLNVTNRGTEESKLQRMASDLRLDNSINFLGFLKRQEIYGFFRSSDIYVSIPSSDGTSVTLLEAMASGLFPVVSDIPANREWIEDGVNGFLVPLGDSATLANKIIQATREIELRKRAAEINRDLVRRKGELKSTMEFIKSQYQRLVDSHPNALSSPHSL